MTDDLKKSNCFTCQTRQKSEWCNLQEDEIAMLDKAKKGHSFKVADVIYTQGEENAGVYCIEEGLIGLRQNTFEGKSTLVRLRSPGETIGYRSFLTQSLHSVTAEVLEPTHACFIPKAAVQELLAKNPSLGLKLLQQKAKDLSYADERFTQSIHLNVEKRLLHILLVLSERFGIREQSTSTIDLPISRTDLASLVGIAPESLSRVIQRLNSSGVANFNGRQVVINNVHSTFDELEDIA